MTYKWKFCSYLGDGKRYFAEAVDLPNGKTTDMTGDSLIPEQVESVTAGSHSDMFADLDAGAVVGVKVTRVSEVPCGTGDLRWESTILCDETITGRPE